MKSLVRSLGILVICACVIPFGLTGCAKSSNEIENVQAEVLRRRALRREAGEAAGVATMPMRVDTKGLVELKLHDVPVRAVAQLLATLSQKEVFVSGLVSKRRISTQDRTLSSRDAVAAILAEMKKEGIHVVSIGSEILVLVDEASDK